MCSKGILTDTKDRAAAVAAAVAVAAATVMMLTSDFIPPRANSASESNRSREQKYILQLILVFAPRKF